MAGGGTFGDVASRNQQRMAAKQKKVIFGERPMIINASIVRKG